jgi:hypothetical protein
MNTWQNQIPSPAQFVCLTSVELHLIIQNCNQTKLTHNVSIQHNIIQNYNQTKLIHNVSIQQNQQRYQTKYKGLVDPEDSELHM